MAVARDVCRAGSQVISSPRGRGTQMNTGARRSTGDLLLFLHADSALPPEFELSIATALESQSLRGRRPARCASGPDIKSNAKHLHGFNDRPNQHADVAD